MSYEEDIFDEARLKRAIAELGKHSVKDAREVAIQTLLIYARNILQHPEIDKYRHIKTSNTALNNRIYTVPAALHVMETWGWRADSEGEHISLPPKVSAHDIRIVVSALEDLHLTDEQRRHKLVVEAERRKIKEREERDHAERERIKQQVALDRVEVSKEEHRDSYAATPAAHPGMHRIHDVPAH